MFTFIDGLLISQLYFGRNTLSQGKVIPLISLIYAIFYLTMIQLYSRLSIVDKQL